MSALLLVGCGLTLGVYLGLILLSSLEILGNHKLYLANFPKRHLNTPISSWGEEYVTSSSM
jgi:hypothetical protein